MNKKSIDEYKRTLLLCLTVCAEEFEDRKVLQVMLCLVADAYALMHMHRMSQTKIQQQLSGALRMFVSSIKHVHPIWNERFQISEAMYSCFVRACLPNTRTKKILTKTPIVFRQFRDWLVHRLCHVTTMEVINFVQAHSIEECLANEIQSTVSPTTDWLKTGCYLENTQP